MINRGNIRSYIEFLHYKKYDIGAKEGLLERWVNLSDFEITKQLSGLYEHWDISPDIAKKYESAFLSKQEKATQPIPAPQIVSSYPNNSDEGDYSRYTKESSSQTPKIIAIVLGLILVLGGIFYFVNQQNELTEKADQLDRKIKQVDQTATVEQQTRIQKEDATRKAKQERLNKIQAIKDNIETYILHKIDYSYDRTFGGISNVTLQVKNNSDFKLDEVTLRLYYVKKNGDLHETQDVTFYNLSPHEQKHLPGPSSNRGVRLEAKIGSVKISD